MLNNTKPIITNLVFTIDIRYSIIQNIVKETVCSDSLFLNYLNNNFKLLKISLLLNYKLNMLKILIYEEPYKFSKICQNIHYTFLCFDCTHHKTNLYQIRF